RRPGACGPGTPPPAARPTSRGRGCRTRSPGGVVRAPAAGTARSCRGSRTPPRAPPTGRDVPAPSTRCTSRRTTWRSSRVRTGGIRRAPLLPASPRASRPAAGSSGWCEPLEPGRAEQASWARVFPFSVTANRRKLPYRRAPMRPRFVVAVFISFSLVGAVSAVGPSDAAAASCTADNRCGMDLERAWSHFTKGDPGVLISYVEAGDLIVAFSDTKDRDHNGYPSDISGWDFYDNQNDPATYDATYDHSDDQMSVIHHECPDCMILPVKAGAEALDRTNDLARAW